MFYLNKIIGAVLNPISIALLSSLAGVALSAAGRRRIGLALVTCSLVWLWLWSTPAVYRFVGGSLESEWPIVDAADAPRADAIVLLGGGVGANTNAYPYAEMANGADRVWYAAKLWKAGKAPVIIPTGSEETNAAVPILVDFGVPRSAIAIENEARNTEENAKFVARLLDERLKNSSRGDKMRRRVLLVTSAWHMRRSVLMFRKYAPELEVMPAATDYEATVRTGDGFELADVLPSADCLAANSWCFKELVGFWGYTLFR